MQPDATLILAADATTAIAGLWNAAWLAQHSSVRPGGRRTAALSLAVLNAGVAAQAVFSQALYSARRGGLDDAPFFEPAPWLASRLLVLGGVLLISMLIIRKRTR